MPRLSVFVGCSLDGFHDGYPATGLDLVGTRSWPSGFVQLAYARR